jgi:hypothetical protein
VVVKRRKKKEKGKEEEGQKKEGKALQASPQVSQRQEGGRNVA